MSDPTSSARRRIQQVLDDLWSQVLAPQESATLLTSAVHIDTAAGSLRVGRDSQGLPHLLIPLPGSGVVPDLLGTAGISAEPRVLLLDDLPVRFLDLGCQRADLVRVFGALSVDMCLRIAALPDSPITAAREVMEEWRSLLDRRPTAWTRQRAAGLFAELIVLRELLTLDRSTVHLWTGPSGQAQDFRGPGGSVEVKATLGREGRVVRIHGSDQLEIPMGGQLHLAWFRLDDNHPSGVTVRNLLQDLGGRTDDQRKWSAVLGPLAIPSSHHPEIDDRRFFVVENRWHRVTESFPRIVPSTLIHGALPGGIGAVEYLLDLDVIPDHLLSSSDQALNDLISTEHG